MHFASEDEARAELDPFLRRWEIEDAVSKGTVGIQFAFDRSSMIDRQPTPGVIEAKGLVTARPLIIGVAKMVADQAAFPAPPTAPSCDIATGRMFPRLKAIWDDDSYLTADGYYILTEVEDRFAPAPAGPPRPRTPSRKRVVAATRLNIDVDVLEKFGKIPDLRGR